MAHNALFLVNSVVPVADGGTPEAHPAGGSGGGPAPHRRDPGSALAAGAAGGDRAFCPGDSGQGGRAPGPMPPEPPGGAGRLLPEPGGPAARGPLRGAGGARGDLLRQLRRAGPAAGLPVRPPALPVLLVRGRVLLLCHRLPAAGPGRGQPPPPWRGKIAPQGGGCPAVPAPAGPAGGTASPNLALPKLPRGDGALLEVLDFLFD